MSRAAFGEAIRDRLHEMKKSQRWLGQEVARLEGRGDAYTQQTVATWLSGSAEPAPRTVFAVEVALSVKPGSLSRLLGYLPPSTRSATSVRDAIGADPKLTAMGRRVLAAAYEQLVDDGPEGS